MVQIELNLRFQQTKITSSRFYTRETEARSMPQMARKKMLGGHEIKKKGGLYGNDMMGLSKGWVQDRGYAMLSPTLQIDKDGFHIGAPKSNHVTFAYRN